jgi:hypothetical protein
MLTVIHCRRRLGCKWIICAPLKTELAVTARKRKGQRLRANGLMKMLKSLCRNDTIIKVYII